MSENISFEDILDAAQRLEGWAVRTPLIRHPWLDEATGGTVLVKPECLQRTGSFKFRGAWNFISRLDAKDNPGGVVAYSSGNHAQGVAAAAQLRGLPALIVMPADTPAIKMENTRRYGAEVVTYDRINEKREEIAAEMTAEMAGTGDPKRLADEVGDLLFSVGLEICRQAGEQGHRLDAICVCTGGGGLTAGVALAAAELSPQTQVYAVEPAGFDDHARSLKAGHRVANEAGATSICDALLAPEPGELTFSVNGKRLAGGLVVSDDEVRKAMRFAFRNLKLVAEPGGAVALASVLSGKIDCRGRTVALTISGGNADPAQYAGILAG